METKTIRFEKDTVFTRIDLKSWFTDEGISELFYRNRSHEGIYEPIKSFTVQINIIEDDK